MTAEPYMIKSDRVNIRVEIAYVSFGFKKALLELKSLSSTLLINRKCGVNIGILIQLSCIQRYLESRSGGGRRTISCYGVREKVCGSF